MAIRQLNSFRKLLVGFTILYALLAGGCVELMCRSLFFALVRNQHPLPGAVEWLMIGQVPPEFFPGDCPYLLLTLFPVLLLGLFWTLHRRREEYRPVFLKALILCNLAVTLIFAVYCCAFLYSWYIAFASELLGPPVRSSGTAIVLRYLFFAVAAALVIAGVISGRRGKTSK